MNEQDDFAIYEDPNPECVRIIGRVINYSSEEEKIKEDGIGLINVSTEQNTVRIKLNLSQVPSFSLFEGEIVVAEGFMGPKNTFNVNRIHKPEARLPASNFSFEDLKLYKSKGADKVI